jgi:H+/Cl- antiporter ClcA
MDRLRRTRRIYGGVMLFCLVDILIGVAVGAIDTLFGHMLLASAFRDAHVFALVPFLAAGALIAWAYLRFGKNAGRGMSLVFDVGLDRENVISLRLIPLIMGGTWITYLFGGSVSREDVTM